MYFGRVVGMVWATVKSPQMVGQRMLVVQPLTPELKNTGKPLICTDGIGAGAGGGVGVGAGVGVITIKDVVDAHIGDNSLVSVGRNITVEADGDKTFQSNVFSFAVGDGASLNGTVSVIGIGMRSHAGVAARAFKALAERRINIRAITTSEIKFSLLIDAEYTELAVRTLHSLYDLDKN